VLQVQKKKKSELHRTSFYVFFLLKFQPEHCYVILSAYLDSIVHLFRIRGALSLHWVKIHCCPLLARQHLIASLGRVAVTAHCCRSIDEPFDPKVMERWSWRQIINPLSWMWRVEAERRSSRWASRAKSGGGGSCSTSPPRGSTSGRWRIPLAEGDGEMELKLMPISSETSS